ncbi:MAG: EFR1 family ferrodoxin [Candidatus Thermoplasmatota archaeon]|nr:EFR1 family ferrodoxin [Candidatus Thermoplasmatota archaeon]
MVDVEIFYFSGSGNSLYVAKELSRRFEHCEISPMVKMLKEGPIRTRGKVVGFVFPIYLASIPSPVREFLERIDPSSADHIFAVATRIGTFSIAPSLLNKYLKRKGRRLDHFEYVNMLSNTPTGLKPGKGSRSWARETGEKDIERIDRSIQPQLDRIAKEIEEKKSRRPFLPLNDLIAIVMDPISRNTRTEVGYFVDDTCIGCGTCERVCLSEKVRMVSGRPRWDPDTPCYYCFACFNYCPEQAILVRKKYDLKEGRYRHATAEEIASQKN